MKYTSTGPCLVEVGTRCHGGEGTWQPIAQECLGYNQVRGRRGGDGGGEEEGTEGKEEGTGGDGKDIIF